jgi:mono/diheme cytochrome c family protein
MTLRRPGRWIFTIAAVLVIVGIAAAAFATRNLLSGKRGGPVQVVNAPPDVVARGKYLAEAADCAACHTAPGGAPFAGGLPMRSGFGTIYATNITPEPDDGIGRWSAEDFWRALHDGVRRDGQQLYPAMPYTSYRGMTRADADAIYAYVMRLRPMKVPLQHPPRHAGLEPAVPARQPSSSVRRQLAGVAARPLSGERAGALWRMPYAPWHGG